MGWFPFFQSEDNIVRIYVGPYQIPVMFASVPYEKARKEAA
jgi:hypothetical protein